MKRSILIFFFLNIFTAFLCGTIESKAQTNTNQTKPKIANVRSQQQGDSVLIYYDILGTIPEQKFNIRIHCSTDGGKTYSEALKSVSGDVGENITGGAGKII
ncbi:MAG: hypothetical protein HY738_01760, partial [Bacteroidia bacterium]|nr:hypothetical protein [Bacteroidia bacterium]